MSATITIQLDPDAQRVLRNLQAMPQHMVVAIAAAMDAANQSALANIIEHHITGKGPYAVAEHRLGERSHLLRKSAHTTAARIDNQTVTSAIGSNVKYAGLHEFGGRIHQPARQVTTRLKTTASGALVRQLGHLAIFAKKSNKRFKEVTSTAKAHDIDIPERAPFRTGITEMLPNYGKSIAVAILGAMKT